jgi:hypothetical protein
VEEQHLKKPWDHVCAHAAQALLRAHGAIASADRALTRNAVPRLA